jgi:hypothetical protein
MVLHVFAMANLRPIRPAAKAESPAFDARECWLAGLTAGRAEGLERALDSFAGELRFLGVSDRVAAVVVARVTARALRA